MELSIGQLRELLCESPSSPSTPSTCPVVGKFCIVRCRNAGVHAGVVESVGDFVVLRDSRRLWKFYSGFTLSEAAVTGIDASKSRVAVEVSELAIPIGDVAELISCTDAARRTIAEATRGSN